MTAIRKFESFYTDLASMKIEQLANVYSQDVVFIDPIAAHEGIAAVENYFSKLLHNAKYCTFTIHEIQETTTDNHVVTWQMVFTSSRMNKGKPIAVDGITILKIADDRVVYHRDYYDLGQMVYENIPFIGRIIKKIKKALS
jgi:ketosteroid isomerase-like protein